MCETIHKNGEAEKKRRGWWKERERERTEGRKRDSQATNIKNTSPRTQMILFRV